MLEAVGVSKHFGGMRAVDDVSFRIERGQIVGLIGPNGAGKTTMFDLLAGAQRPSAGSILIDGVRVEREAAHRRLARGLGRTFQIPRPFAEMTVIENVLLAAPRQAGERLLWTWFRPGQVAREERENLDRARALLDFLNLSALAGEPARTLSGGQRKLLELARVLMAEPSAILLDEPTAGVNRTLRGEILARIAEINRRGVTILIVEHDMEVIARLCPRVIVMAQGRILREGAPAAIAADREVVEAYLGGAPA